MSQLIGKGGIVGPFCSAILWMAQEGYQSEPLYIISRFIIEKNQENKGGIFYILKTLSSYFMYIFLCYLMTPPNCMGMWSLLEVAICSSKTGDKYLKTIEWVLTDNSLILIIEKTISKLVKDLKVRGITIRLIKWCEAKRWNMDEYLWYVRDWISETDHKKRKSQKEDGYITVRHWQWIQLLREEVTDESRD